MILYEYQHDLNLKEVGMAKLIKPLYLGVTVLFLVAIMYSTIINTSTIYAMSTVTLVSRGILVLLLLLFIFFLYHRVDNNRLYQQFVGAVIVLTTVTSIMLLFAVDNELQELSRGYLPPSWYILGKIGGVEGVLRAFSQYFYNLDIISTAVMGSVFTSNLFILCMGFGLYFLFIYKNFPEFWIYVSYPLGTVALILYVAILLFFGVEITTSSLFYLPAVIITVLVLVRAYSYGFDRAFIDKLVNLIPKIAISTMVVLFFSFVPSVVLSFDSMVALVMSSTIAAEGNFAHALVPQPWPGGTVGTITESHFLSFGFFTSTMSLFTYLRGNPFFNFAYQPVITVLCFLLIFNWLLNKSDCYKSTIALYGMFFSFITIPMVLIHSQWLLNNLSIGLFMAIAFIFYYEYSEKPSKTNLAFMVLFLSVASIIRIEGFVFLAVIMVCLYQSNIQEPVMRRIFIFMFAVSVLWSLGLFVFSAGYYRPDGWNPRNGAIQVSLVGVVTLYYCLRDKIRIPYTKGREYIVMIFVFLAIMVITSVLDLRNARVNYNVLLNVHFALGYWNLFILSVLVLLVCGFATGKITQKHFALISVLPSYMLAIHVLNFFGELTLHTGTGSSGLRMLLHITPAAFVVIAQVAIETLNEQSKEKRKA